MGDMMVDYEALKRRPRLRSRITKDRPETQERTLLLNDMGEDSGERQDTPKELNIIRTVSWRREGIERKEEEKERTR